MQEVTIRLPGRVQEAETAFASANDLANALRRAEAAHGQQREAYRAARRELVRLVRGVHGGGAGRQKTAAIKD